MIRNYSVLRTEKKKDCEEKKEWNRDLVTYGQYKNSNLWVIGVLGGKQGENGAEKIFEGQ